MTNNEEIKSKSNIWSYLTLFFITGIIGFPVVILIGKIISKMASRPITSTDNYGWRGVGTGTIFFGIFSLLVGINVIIQGETDSVLGTIFVTLMFGIAPVFIGKKLIIDWT